MKQSLHSILEITGVVLMHQKTVGCILKAPCACLLGHIAWRLHLMVIEGSSNLRKYLPPTKAENTCKSSTMGSDMNLL